MLRSLGVSGKANGLATSAVLVEFLEVCPLSLMTFVKGSGLEVLRGFSRREAGMQSQL